MSLRDALTLLIIIALWAAVFVPLLRSAYRRRCALAAEKKKCVSRDELRAFIEPQLRVALPLFWICAGLITGFAADHPVSVGSGILFVRFLFFLVGGRQTLNVWTFFLHAFEFAGGAALGYWLHTVTLR